MLPLLALLAATFALAGCNAADPIEIPFLFEHEPTADRTEDTFPLLLSGLERLPAKDETRAWALWPAFRWEREGRERQLWLLGAPIYRSRIDHRGFEDFDLIAGPVLLGSSVDEGRYFGVLPVGGTLKGILGKDYVAFFLLPLFLYAEDRDFASTHVLFPLLNVWSGGGRSGGRFFPFFAHYRRKDRDGRLAFRRTWILWPLWQTLENNLNSPAGAQKMWFLFPFYGRSDGPDTHQWTLLWPLFKWAENRGSSFGGPGWDLRAPWPFVHIARSRLESITDIWPFFGVKERNLSLAVATEEDRFFRRFVLWPFWRDETHTTEGYHDERQWLFPFFWHFRRDHRMSGRTGEEWKLWPLFRYKRWEDGRRSLNVISPLWFQDPDGAFERIYGPLTRVYHEWVDEDGASRLDLLWGLFGRRAWRTARREEAARTSLLFGMFQYERRGGRKQLRFFWLPTGPEWGEGAERPPREGDDGAPARSGGQRTPG